MSTIDQVAYDRLVADMNAQEEHLAELAQRIRNFNERIAELSDCGTVAREILTEVMQSTKTTTP